MDFRLRELGPDDEHLLLACAGADVFDADPTPEWSRRFLTSPGHHLVLATGDDGAPVGFVSGVTMTHPDKGTEMFLYELGVAERARRQGIGHALVERLADVARREGCVGMWVLTDTDNDAAQRTYVGAGGSVEDPPALMITWTFSEDPTPGHR
ncbi:GCN5-related protein N-acetyltransferase [Beutenbergia cavernae DSM 12333]|uniref:GCN5-related protein N-acetyltransferase n=1 Tax=Beutenbergia cavernae (strain ATCC BAA-8 / DSM 12333 / CCUG 43141 / JCM 11478 / NBRC 16432 / NCIMB 13614 / HKI 0122) TaxID=471853 RepID=C5C3U2_BEUC1|nr:GNAT family N-acetyltransferase [Beutenbergia cavernae]ACQ82001.1 GCN5-related protein N-acetyltransferase [Beutenbergia cavernae DSM 12333]